MTAPRHQPRKRFGQHFLSDRWARKVVAAIEPEPGDVFLEIGPGAGALTLPLAESGAPILAVEIDRDLVAALAARAPANVTLISGDILKTDIVPYLSGLEPQRPQRPQRPEGTSEAAQGTPSKRRFRVVGNLPYNLTTPILFRLIELQERHRLFADATLMVQREVADRLAARPGTRDYGVLTVMIRLHGGAARILDLPPGAFSPPPKVRSAVIRLEFNPAPVRITDFRLFERVVKGVFSQRRKTLSNSLKGLTARPAEVLEAAGIDARRRPETLTLEELAQLVDRIAAALRPPVL